MAKLTVRRGSVTGKFVKKSYAKKHPRTTETERMRVARGDKQMPGRRPNHGSCCPQWICLAT
jgi:hypothetical protein